MPEIPHLTSIPYLPCHLLTPTCLLIRLSCHCRHALKRRFLLEQCLCRRATACVATFPIVFTFAKACSRHCAFVVAKKKLFLPMPVAFYTQLLHAVASKETCWPLSLHAKIVCEFWDGYMVRYKVYYSTVAGLSLPFSDPKCRMFQQTLQERLRLESQREPPLVIKKKKGVKKNKKSVATKIHVHFVSCVIHFQKK